MIDGVSFTIRKGETVALVGPSGGGKSTLSDLLPRFYDVTSGAILVDGSDLREYQLDSLRSHMGIVTQETILFNDTIAGNIRLGKRDATDAEVEAAARVANADGFIRETEHGYDTNVGDRGMKLSGGQRQRVAIARALASDPEVLLCDEATSALDPMTTQAILRLLQKINREMGITIVVITHEMAVIRQICTHVAILDGGVIAEEGSVDDVFTHTRSEAGKRLFGIVASENHEQVQEKPAIRIVFNGETIAEPIVADLILHLGVPLSIRSADVHTLNGAQYGQLLISRPDDPMVCHRAIEYLKERGLTVEEVRA